MNTNNVQNRVWGNYELQVRYSTGVAARGNRGSYSGQKIHRVCIAEIVRVIDEAAEMESPAQTLGKQFIARRKPVVFSIRPCCGCTQGQNAAKERAGLDVTCEKCACKTESA